MKRLLLALLCFPHLGLATGEPAAGSGARAAGLSYAYTAIGRDVWSVFHNPAGISGISGFQAGTFLERRFLLNELNYGGAALALPFYQAHAAGLGVSAFGFGDYRENQLSLTYAIEAAPGVRLGVRGRLQSLAITGYGATAVVCVDAGIQVRIHESLDLGFRGQNLSRSRMTFQNGSEQEMPTLAAAGLVYQPSKQVLITTEVVKDLATPLGWRLGVEYLPVEALALRGGVSQQPRGWTVGMGWNQGPVSIDFAYGNTAQLGFTPTLSLVYRFSKNT